MNRKLARCSRPPSFRLVTLSFCVLASVTLCASSVAAQNVSGIDRERGITMLEAIKSDLKKNYYDPTFRGMDVDERFKAAKARIGEATSFGQILGILAQALLDLDDSHTFLIPPNRSSRTDYGWLMQLIGDKCYVTAVKPKSGAEASGLKVGSEVSSIDGYEPSRENLWKIRYAYYALRPRAVVRLQVTGPDSKARQLDVKAKIHAGRPVLDVTGESATSSFDINELERTVEEESRLYRQRYYEIGDELAIWKMPEFSQLKEEIDTAMGKIRKRKALILDLRGNPGGNAETVLRLIGHFFDHNVPLGELKRRKETKPLVAKTVGNSAYKGQLVVLVDSDSGSAAELFARVIQLEKRGAVLGDRTSGAVMMARVYDHQLGIDTVSYYAVSVTDANIIMSDGKSLEKIGVTPDELVLPTGSDLAAGRDPVLARAAALVGVNLTPEKAGTLFPIEWKQ